MDTRTALRRIAAADDDVEAPDDLEQQYEMYAKTFAALADVEADDGDEGIAVVTDWIVEQLETTGARPSSRAVRQRATAFCRRHGYAVPNDAWLGR